MLIKAILKEQIDSFHETFSIDDLVERLIFLEKVEKGNQDSLNNNIISEKELDEETEKWFK